MVRACAVGVWNRVSDATAKFRAGTWIVMGSCKNSPCKSSDGSALASAAFPQSPENPSRIPIPMSPQCWGRAKAHHMVTVHHTSAPLGADAARPEMAQTPEGQDTTPHHEDRSMTKHTNLLASLAVAIGTMIATSHATYAQTPLPTAHVTIGLEEESKTVRERDGVAIIAIGITAGADTLPSNVGVGFNLELRPFNAVDQYNKHEGEYYDYEAPHADGGKYYIAMDPGQTRVEIPITVIDDELVENFQRFTVHLSRNSATFLPGGAVHEDSSLTLSPAEGQVAILDNDSAKMLMRDRHTYVNENVGEIEIVQEVREKLIEYNFTVIHLTIRTLIHINFPTSSWM